MLCIFFYLFLKWGIYNTYDPKKDERTDGRMDGRRTTGQFITGGRRGAGFRLFFSFLSRWPA